MMIDTCRRTAQSANLAATKHLVALLLALACIVGPVSGLAPPLMLFGRVRRVPFMSQFTAEGKSLGGKGSVMDLRAPARSRSLSQTCAPSCALTRLQAHMTLATGDHKPDKQTAITAAYILVKDPVDVHLDAENDPYRVQPIKPDAGIVQLCAELMNSSCSAKLAPEEGAAQALRSLSNLPVAVELESPATGRRMFIMPGNVTVSLRERSYSQSGLGGSLWGSGIALAILLSQGPRRLSRGVTLLELGSGVGLTGLSCALGGAVTTLSDWGGMEEENAGKQGGAAVGPNPKPSAPLNPKAAQLALTAKVLDKIDEDGALSESRLFTFSCL